MDNNTSLNINVDGSPFVPGEPMKPKTFTITMQGEPPKNVLTQADIIARRNERTAKQGQFAWAKLHSYTGCDPQWLDLWQYFIPQRCDCKDGYQKILDEMPPDFTSQDAFFAWGVRLHNAVNRKLGKPELTIDEAKTIWRRNDGCSENSGSNLP